MKTRNIHFYWERPQKNFHTAKNISSTSQVGVGCQQQALPRSVISAIRLRLVISRKNIINIRTIRSTAFTAKTHKLLTISSKSPFIKDCFAWRHKRDRHTSAQKPNSLPVFPSPISYIVATSIFKQVLYEPFERGKNLVYAPTTNKKKIFKK